MAIKAGLSDSVSAGVANRAETELEAVMTVTVGALVGGVVIVAEPGLVWGRLLLDDGAVVVGGVVGGVVGDVVGGVVGGVVVI